jgi:hypothetical protein
MNNIVRNENDPMVDGIDVAPTAPHTLSLSLSLRFGSTIVLNVEIKEKEYKRMTNIK